MCVCLDWKLVTRYGFILFVLSSGASVAAQEPHDAHAGHAQTGDQGIPATRAGSGTSWLPDESPMYAVHAQSKGWMFMGHGAAFLQYLHESGDRGSEQTGSINWLMGMARRSAGGGQVTLRANDAAAGASPLGPEDLLGRILVFTDAPARRGR